jgi:hypothetical protein
MAGRVSECEREDVVNATALQVTLSGGAARRFNAALAANGTGKYIVDEVGVPLAFFPTGNGGWTITQNGKHRLELESCGAPGV